MDASRLLVRTRPGALLVTMAVVILTFALPTDASAQYWARRRVAADPPAAMAVDDRAHVHVVTQDGGGLRYVTDDSGEGGRWISKPITSFGSEPAIGISGGKAYVVFARIGDCPGDEQGCRTDPNRGLYLATNRSGTWRVQRLAGTRPAYWPSLRMRDGKLHIAYSDVRGIRYLTNRSGSWVNTRVWSRPAGLTSAARTSIALDDSGRPSIAFMRTGCTGRTDFGWCSERDTSNQGISYAARVRNAWRTTMVIGAPAALDRVLIDPSGRPRIGYTYLTPCCDGGIDFRVARLVGERVHTRFLPGSGPGSFTLDASGRIEFVGWADGRLTWRAERSSGWISHSWSAPGIRVAWVRSVGDLSIIVRDGFAASVPAYSTWVLTRWLCCGG